MNPLPDSFLRPAGDSGKRTASRPAPFSSDEFSNAVIEQGSQVYVQQIEQGEPPNEPVPTESDSNEPTSSPTANVPEQPRRQKPSRSTQQTQVRPQTTATTASDKANIRLEIAPTVRKDMIKIKHRVGMLHGVEVSYAAYFMFLHERQRAEHNTPAFLAELAQFTEQLKNG